MCLLVCLAASLLADMSTMFGVFSPNTFISEGDRTWWFATMFLLLTFVINIVMFNTLIAMAGDIFCVVLGRRDQESAITKSQVIQELEASHLALFRRKVTLRGRECHSLQLRPLIRRRPDVEVGIHYLYTLKARHSEEDISQAHEGGGITAIASLAPKLESLLATVEHLKATQEKLAKQIAGKIE
jgi:hypothetical protein